MVSFYLFKRNIKFPHDYVLRLLIKNQVEEFLNQNIQNIEEIKVTRTENSITLHYDCKEFKEDLQENRTVIKTESKPAIIYEEEQQDFEEEYEALVNYHCSKCDKIESSENEAEVHEFLRHSSFGAHLEAEIENSKVYAESAEIDELFYVCKFCSLHLERFDLLLFHLLSTHTPDVLFQVNETLNVPSHMLQFQVISSYLSSIKECLMQPDKQICTINYEHKKYFYDIYGEAEGEVESNVSEEDIHQEQEIEFNEFCDSAPEHTVSCIKKEKSEKLSDELSLNDKEWIRNEISKSKFLVNTETGEKRAVYRCLLSDDCSHVSNSAPGLRYHLIIKHLKNRKDFQERKKSLDSHDGFENYSYIPKNSRKNCCNDCSLKFKDSRAYSLHERCHELLATVANHSNTIFPSCNTCNQKFLTQDHLQIHLNKHDKNENLLEPIETGVSAIRQQGKILSDDNFHSYGETNVTDYTWKCGHCENKNFSKEEYCNLHMLLFHTVSFVCPVDKMEFSGFKSVSLFIHHLRNKHPELFPNLSFKCTFCQMEFPTIYDKLNHMKNCEKKNLQCDHCDKRFWKKGDLIAHLKYVTGEVQFQCSICMKRCISASDLKIHLRSHTKIKPYK